eukprot:UN05271
MGTTMVHHPKILLIHSNFWNRKYIDGAYKCDITTKFGTQKSFLRKNINT